MEGGIARLLATSDLRINHPRNRLALVDVPVLPDDHLLVPGDVGDDPEAVGPQADGTAGRGPAPRSRGGLSRPWRPHAGRPSLAVRRAGRSRAGGVVLLYDNSFRPDDVAREDVVAWAAVQRIRPTDERFLRADPHPSVDEWSAQQLLQATVGQEVA